MIFKRTIAILGLVSLILSLPFSACAVQPPVMFPFVIPWDDATPGTATDMSFLNAKPAGVNGGIVVKNGHFVESKMGNRVLFLGTNFTFEANYPTHADADKIAAHLAKLGINIVRIHHHDDNNGPLWDKTIRDRRVFSAEGIDRLDYLIAQLKKNGVYVNLNLHVSRNYLPLDGFPPSVTKMPVNYDKRIDIMDQHMIDLQKQFARDYLTHVNPYTKLSYTDDPCVAVVEINNENSLVGDAASDHNKFFQALPEPFHREVVAQWNAWLAKKYGTQSRLLAAWAPSTTVVSSQGVLNATVSWAFEDASRIGTLTKLTEGTTAMPADLQIVSPQKAEQPWQEQVTLSGLDLTEGAMYLVSFRAKADKARDMNVYAGVAAAPDWHHIGLDARPTLDSDWKSYRFMFQATKMIDKKNRLVFVLGGESGTVWLSHVKLEPVTADSLLPDGQNLEHASIAIPIDGTNTQNADWVRFLCDTEAAYADEMRGYLRNVLKVKANMIDTQMSFGKVSSFGREADSDFADDHAYWQHPQFPHKPWDPVDWSISNSPMVDALASGTVSEFEKLAQYRVAGKPFCVSEYNHPAPSDYQAEMYPEFASFAAFQDWDMIYGFDYGAYGIGRKNEQIQSFFDTGPNPAKAGFLPAAALIFRTGGFAPASSTATLHLNEDAVVTGHRVSEYWKGKFDILASRLEVMPIGGDKSVLIRRDERVGKSTSSIKATKTAIGGQYIAVGANSAVITGFVGGTSVQAGSMAMTFSEFGNNFASLTLTSIDDKPLTQSGRLLLTAMGKVENQGLLWNNSHTSVGRDWGHAPVQAEGIPGTVTFANSLIHHVWALDATGARVQEIPVTSNAGSVRFDIGPDYKTIWYEMGK